LNILITGGAGFIGSHLVEYCLQQGHQVKAVDNLTGTTLENIRPFQGNPNFSFTEADIVTWPVLGEKVKWADIIFHLAAIVGVKRVLKDPVKVITTNIGGCERLFSVIGEAKVKPRVMVASSSMVYGSSEQPILKEGDQLIIQSTAQGHWSYAISKLADESTSFAYFREKQIPITIMRIFNTVGPRQKGDYGMVMPTFIHQACRGEPITIYGDGSQTRSFCDVRDLVRLMEALAKTPKSIGQVVNLGHRDVTTIKDLAGLIKQRTKSASSLEYIPYTEAYGEAFDDIHARQPDLSKLAGMIDLHFDWTLTATVDDLILIQRNTEKNI